MKAIWQPSPLDRNVPQYDLLRSAGCNRIYFAAEYETFEDGVGTWHFNDIQLNPTFYNDVVKNKFQYGIFRVTSWDNAKLYGDAGTLASTANEDINAASGGNKYAALPYMFDIEQHDPAFILATFKAYRKLRPTRRTAWTMEPHQGGWMKNYLVNGQPVLVDFINNDPYFFLLPQLFYGNMSPANQNDVRNDLLAAGFKSEKILFFYDSTTKTASQWKSSDWSGSLLDAEHLTA